MKFSTLQIIAIACILAIGFLMVASLVQTAEAHGERHWYVATVYEWLVEKCTCCGLTNYWLIDWYTTMASHPDNVSHEDFDVYYVVNTDLCIVCAFTGSCATSS